MAINKKSRFVLASLIGSLALSAISFSMSLAWYIGGTQLGVEGLEIEIGAQGELEISATPLGGYTDKVGTEDIGGTAPSNVEGVYITGAEENLTYYEVIYHDGSKKTFVDEPYDSYDEGGNPIIAHHYLSPDELEIAMSDLGTWVFDGVDSGIAETGRLIVPKYFDSVSTMFQENWLNDENSDPVPSFFYYPSLFTPSTGIPHGPKEALSGFYSRALYLRATDNAYVSLDPSECYLKPDDFLNAKTAKELRDYDLAHGKDLYTEEEYFERLSSLAQAMRISIYDCEKRAYYIFDPHKDGDTFYGGILDNDRDGYFDTYMTNEGMEYETVYGQIEDRSLISYGERLGEEIPLEGELSSFNAAHKIGTFPYDGEGSYANGLRFAKEESLSFGDASSEDPEANPFVMELEAYKPKKIVLSIYMEGWDDDCININMAGSFLAKLQFRIIRRMVK